MPRAKHPDLGVVKPFGNKDTNLHIRIDHQLDGLLRAAAAHAGMGVSNYVRWMLQQATKQTLAGPSKADQLREASEKMARVMAPLEPIPEHAIVKPRDPSIPLPVVEHAPTNFKPKADINTVLPPAVAKVVTALSEAKTFGQPATPPPGVPASLPPLPAHRTPEPAPFTLPLPQSPPTRPQKLSMELTPEEFTAFYVRPHESGPKPLELPDDMSDWT